jgi:hypothetical protein
MKQRTVAPGTVASFQLAHAPWRSARKPCNVSVRPAGRRRSQKMTRWTIASSTYMTMKFHRYVDTAMR